MTEATEGAFYHKPTMRQRFWRAAGFSYHLGEDPEGIEALSGWMRTDLHLHFGWVDRLRLLLTGKLFIASTVHTDTPSPLVCKTRMDWRIGEPGSEW